MLTSSVCTIQTSCNCRFSEKHPHLPFSPICARNGQSIVLVPISFVRLFLQLYPYTVCFFSSITAPSLSSFLPRSRWGWSCLGFCLNLLLVCLTVGSIHSWLWWFVIVVKGKPTVVSLSLCQDLDKWADIQSLSSDIWLFDSIVLTSRSWLWPSCSRVRQHLCSTVSLWTLTSWAHLYERTLAVIWDPLDYEKRGRHTKFSDEDLNFMLELIEHDPTLYLDEVQLEMYHTTDQLVSLSTIASDLQNCLRISLKKAQTVHPKQCLIKQAQYLDQVAGLPSNMLVFLGQSFLGIVYIKVWAINWPCRCD